MRKRPDSAALVMGSLREFSLKSPSGPAGQRRHRGQNRGNVAAGLQAENRAAIIEQIELDVTPTAHQLLLTLGSAPRLFGVAPDDIAIGSKEALADVAHKGEVRVEGGIASVARAVEIVEEDAADSPRLLAMLEIE